MSSKQMLQTFVKDKVNIMPDDINSEKEIIEYVKSAIKEGKVDMKTKKESKKKINSNEERPKYSLSSYQEYMKEKQVIFKENYPELSSKERLVKIAEEWNKFKETDEYKEMNKKKENSPTKIKTNDANLDEEVSGDEKEVKETCEVCEPTEEKDNKNDEVNEVAVKKKKAAKK
jgi:hypothetical protein